MRIHAPAKLNLCLFLGPRREDGLHSLCSLFEPLSLADSIEVSEAERDEAAAIVGAFEGATETAVEGAQLRTRVANGAQAIPGILSALDARGIPVASVTTARPSLDDVYLHYTGRDFSAEDAAG